MTTRSELLSDFGLPGLITSSIQPYRQGFGPWRIRFNYEKSEPLSMSSAQATEMAVRLHQIGEAELANEIETAVERARRYQTM